jgi:hypothetical protein
VEHRVLDPELLDFKKPFFFYEAKSGQKCVAKVYDKIIFLVLEMIKYVCF